MTQTAPPHRAVPAAKPIIPPVDGGVALVEPLDGWQLVSGSHGTQVDQQVVLRDHQVQRTHNVPAGKQAHTVTPVSWTQFFLCGSSLMI